MHTRLVLVSALLLCPALPAAADPVSATYLINVTQRFDYSAQQLEPFARTFMLTLSFPGDATKGAVLGGYGMEYSHPSFSGVPSDLVLPAPPPGMELTHTEHIVDFYSEDAGRGLYRITAATVSDLGREFDAGSGTTTDYQRVLSLGEPGRPPQPRTPLTLESALERLGSGSNPTAFLYGGFLALRPGGFAANSYQYQGSSQLISLSIPADLPDPVPAPGQTPEPASVVLLATGALGCVRRMRRVR